MSIAAILFDMDGVIVDSLPIHARAAQNVLRRYGFSVSKKEYYTRFAGMTDEAGFAQYFAGNGANIDLPAVLGQKADEYMRLCQGNLVPYPGVLEFINSLAGRGIKLGLVTGALRAEAELTLKSFSIRGLFDAVIAAEDISHSKPHPEGYLRGLKALEESPERCIVIEDAPEGVQRRLVPVCAASLSQIPGRQMSCLRQR